MNFDLALPIDMMFNAIEMYTNIAEASGSPVTQHPCYNLAHIILKKSNMFTTYLERWENSQDIQKTSNQFKIDFCIAVKQLQRTGSLQSNHLHANIVSKIVSGI